MRNSSAHVRDLLASNPNPQLSALQVYRDVAAGLRGCLDLADQAAAAGNIRLAAEYTVGAITDLAAELGALEQTLID